MIANRLTKFYSALDAKERLSLLLAAAGRNDDVEHERVANAAKMVRWEVPDTFAYSLAFLLTFALHRSVRLNDAGLYFAARMVAGTAGKEGWKPELQDFAQMHAHYVLGHAAAWQLFLSRAQLDPTSVEPAFPGANLLEMAESLAKAEHPLTADEAQKIASEKAGQPIEAAYTPESEAEELREIHETILTKWWGM